MKTLRISLIAAAFAVAACGEDVPEEYTFASGTYALSNVVLASQSDQCGLFEAYTDPAKRIGISVNGTQVTFNLSNNPEADPVSLDKAELNGNAIEQLIATNYTVAFDDTCVVRVHRTVTGTVVDNDTAALTLDFSVSTEAGTCNGDNTAFAAVPCSSTYEFTATRQ